MKEQQKGSYKTDSLKRSDFGTFKNHIFILKIHLKLKVNSS